MASITKAKNGYRAQVYVLGQRASAVLRTKREAEAWAAAKETELRTFVATPAGERTALRAVLERYRDEVSPSKRGHRWEFVRINLFLRHPDLPLDMPLGKVTPVEIAAFRDARSRTLAPNSVIREMAILSAVFEQARREWRLVQSNPVQDVRRPKSPDHRDVVISRQQIRAMLREMGYSPQLPIRTVAQAVACTFLAALRTGMRAASFACLLERLADAFADIAIAEPSSSLQALGIEIDLDALTVDIGRPADRALLRLNRFSVWHCGPRCRCLRPHGRYGKLAQCAPWSMAKAVLCTRHQTRRAHHQQVKT